MYLQFKLSECTYSSNSLTVLRVAIGIKSSWDCNYFRKDIDLIIIKVNHYCQCFSFISTFVSIYLTLYYSTFISNCLNVLTVQTVWMYLQFKLSECTYSSNSLTVLRVAIGIKSSWDCQLFQKSYWLDN